MVSVSDNSTLVKITVLIDILMFMAMISPRILAIDKYS